MYTTIIQVRTIRYHQIAEELKGRVMSGAYASGRLLPSESDMSAEFSVSRVTIRKALEVLRDMGLVDARQGFGWFVAGETVRQPLARLATIEDQMRASGMTPQRQVLEFAFEKAPTDVAKALGTSQVLRVRRINLADGEPVLGPVDNEALLLEGIRIGTFRLEVPRHEVDIVVPLEGHAQHLDRKVSRLINV